MNNYHFPEHQENDLLNKRDLKTMIQIRYDLIGAYKAGVKEHPQKDVEKLGMNVISFEGVPIADCVIMEVESVPDVLPLYINLL